MKYHVDNNTSGRPNMVQNNSDTETKERSLVKLVVERKRTVVLTKER